MKLEEIGLTPLEIKTYKALLKLDQTKTGPLCDETGIASSNIYRVLDKLMKKGLATYQIRNNTRIYMAAPPEKVEELYESKIQTLSKDKQEAVDELKNLQKHRLEEDRKQDFKYYEGIAGIKGLLNDVEENMKQEEGTLRIYSTEEGAMERLLGYYNQWHEDLDPLNRTFHLILDETMEDLGERRETLNTTEVRYTEKTNEAQWGVYRSSFFVFHYVTEKPYGILYEDPVIADTFKEVFEKVWHQAQTTA